jgi:hypothetical protein
LTCRRAGSGRSLCAGRKEKRGESAVFGAVAVAAAVFFSGTKDGFGNRVAPVEAFPASDPVAVGAAYERKLRMR